MLSVCQDTFLIKAAKPSSLHKEQAKATLQHSYCGLVSASARVRERDARADFSSVPTALASAVHARCTAAVRRRHSGSSAQCQSCACCRKTPSLLLLFSQTRLYRANSNGIHFVSQPTAIKDGWDSRGLFSWAPRSPTHTPQSTRGAEPRSEERCRAQVCL